MQKKYTQPLQIFIVFEKLNSNIWLSKKLNINHSLLLIPNNWFYAINTFFKKELFLNNSTLIENTAIDTSNYNIQINQFNLLNNFNSNNVVVLYNYYNYFTKNKITLLILLNKFSKSIDSIDRLFSNANWLERETSEMYGINYKWKTDTRKLLLDYSKIENPMLKEFQTEGLQDTFYSIFENQVITIKNETVEL